MVEKVEKVPVVEVPNVQVEALPELPGHDVGQALGVGGEDGGEGGGLPEHRPGKVHGEAVGEYAGRGDEEEATTGF